jgi:UDP-N-acetylglucosamine 2-epimerase
MPDNQSHILTKLQKEKKKEKRISITGNVGFDWVATSRCNSPTMKAYN